MTIKELRLMKGLTLANFAKSIGIGLSTLTGYEAGKRAPSEKALAAIKEVYGVDLNEKDTPAAVEAAPAAPAAVEAAPAAPAAVEAAPAAPVKEKKAAKKPAAKKEKAAKAEPAEKPAPAAKKEKTAKAPAKKATATKAAEIIIQSPMGGEITADEIMSRIGDVDKVYIRIDQNAAYWVKGDESGAINLW